MSCCSGKNNAEALQARGSLNNDLTLGGCTPYTAASPCADVMTPTTGCAHACNCQSIPATPEVTREYRLCTDQCGCAAHYPAECRNLYWPSFSHPRWLPCGDLYCVKASNR